MTIDSVLIEVAGLPEKKFREGEVILKEGKLGEKVYILKEGSVSVTLAGSEICKVNTTGTVFGEISALLKSTYTATVTAETDAVLYVINDLSSLLREDNKACFNIARILALRIVNMSVLFSEIKQEIYQAQRESPTIYNRLLRCMTKIDNFWGRSVFDPLGKSSIL